MSSFHVGSDWTTVHTRLPVVVDDQVDCTTCSSVVYDKDKLLIIGNYAGKSKYQGPRPSSLWLSIGSSASAPDLSCGFVLDFATNIAHAKILEQATLPPIGGIYTGALLKHKNHDYLTTMRHPISSDTKFSKASSVVLVNNRYLYAIVCNQNADHLNDGNGSNHNNNPQKQNSHGYTPQEELYVADLKRYMEQYKELVKEQNKGLVDKALDWLYEQVPFRSCGTGVDNSAAPSSTANHPPAPFWQPITEMEQCGSSLTGTTIGQFQYLFATGGYTTLLSKPKFYQVFSEKERVACAAHVFKVPVHQEMAMETEEECYWQRLPDMNVRRKNLQTVIVQHYLYAIGGQDETGSPVALVERLDLSLALSAINNNDKDIIPAWEPVASMSHPRHSFSATVIPESGIIVVAGGHGPSGRLNTVEYLSVASTDDSSGYSSGAADEWKPLPNLQTPRTGASLCCVKNNSSKLVIAGGTETTKGVLFEGSGPLGSIETLDILAIAGTSSQFVSATSAPFAPRTDSLPMATAELLPEWNDPPTAPSATVAAVASTSSHVLHHDSVTWGIQPTAPTLQEVHDYQASSQQSATAMPISRQDANNASINAFGGDDDEDIVVVGEDDWLPCSPLQPPVIEFPLPPAMAPPTCSSQLQQHDELEFSSVPLPPPMLPPKG